MMQLQNLQGQIQQQNQELGRSSSEKEVACKTIQFPTCWIQSPFGIVLALEIQVSGPNLVVNSQGRFRFVSANVSS